MMNQRKKIETAFEIARVVVFGSNWRDCAAWCSGCESYVPIVTLMTAATLEKTSIAEIFRRAETGEVHHKVTVKGELLVCLCSLLETCQESDKSSLFQFDKSDGAGEEIAKTVSACERSSRPGSH